MSRQKLDWQEVVVQNPQGYVEIQNHKAGTCLHGPVEKIELDDTDLVHITLKWVAQMPLPGRPGFGTWSVGPEMLKQITIVNFATPFAIEPTPEKGPRVRWGMGNIMYLEPVDDVDPSRVKGLVLQTATAE